MKFTCYDSRDRKEYINKIKRILKDNGILFLKCFSDKEPMDEGPYKFSPVSLLDETKTVIKNRRIEELEILITMIRSLRNGSRAGT